LTLASDPSAKLGERLLATLLPEREKGLGDEGKALIAKDIPRVDCEKPGFWGI